ncbi:MAG: DNA alkylation repair protein [Prevotella sp.]|nr:DNA alkylation repair protein [Prevotella sp.]MBP3843221.1 DNA alkylation repair protein [Prevotella sp.]
MNEDIQERVKEIKRSFRLIMDGATSTSMREKGLDYKLNWGANLMQLREKAEELGKDYHLAIALWKEDIRECKILATMVMPPKEMLPEIADIWMEQTPTVEIAEQAAFNLYQHLDYASDKAFLWLSSPDDLPQICGYHVLSRLFMRKYEPDERDINEFIDQALVALQSQNPILQKAAMQSMIHFANLGLVYERLAQSAIRRIQMNFI